MSEEIKNDFCQQSETGRKLFNTFVDERLKTGKFNFWLTMRKMKLKTWKSSCKIIKMKTAVKVVELKENRSLFARLMMICKSRPEVDIKETITLYEFSVVPKSLFAPDGTMLHCPCKHALMHIPVYYRVSDSTHIKKVPLKKLLSHTKTKAELTALLAKKVKERGQALRGQLVVAWGKECEATHNDMGHLQSDYEKADTKIILHTLNATADSAMDLIIHSPDTDILMLAIRWSSEMCLNTSFVTGRGLSHRSIKLQQIAEALGPKKSWLHCPHFMPSQGLIILVASQARERYLVGKHF